ncbi:MAG: SulP family inorganic anion transporter [Pirellulales bacterium]
MTPKPTMTLGTGDAKRQDLTASLIVFLVALPLAMGAAVAAGFPVSAGLTACIVGGLVVSLLGGAPLVVTGPSVALTVLVYQAWQQHGIESLGVLVIACGVLQILFAAFRLGVWYRAVSPAVLQGLMAGIGALIFASQFHVMVDDRPQATGMENLVTIPDALAKGFPPPALETAEQRAAVRAAMDRLSGLHQRQNELLEEVHHLLAGAAANVVVDADTPPNGEEDEALVEHMLLVSSLQNLAPRQKAIVDELATLRGDNGATAIPDALAGANKALVDLEAGDVASARASQDAAESLLLAARDTTKHHRWAATVGILTIVIIIGWQSLVVPRFRYVPGVIVAVAVMTAAATIWDLPLSFVELPERIFGETFFPNLGELARLTEPAMLILAVEFALVASAETLLCATRIDRRHSGPRSNFNRELLGQGVANVCCGLLRALPVAGSLVASAANARAGAQSRVAALAQSLLTVLFVVAAVNWLHLVPVSALAAVMVYTGFRLIDHRSALRLWRDNRQEAAIFIATAVAVFVVGLLPGLLIGLACSIGRLVWEFSRLEIERKPEPEFGRYTLTLRGNATFLRLPYLADALAEVPRDAELHLNVEGLDVIDRACLDLLHDWQRENEPYGARLALNQDSLAARFWRRPRRRLEENGQVKHKRERQVPI